MNRELFSTANGDPIPAVTAAEMAEIDRIAIEEFGLQLRQMMEHAGRTLAKRVLDGDGDCTVVAGGGGNGGGGLACSRHLATRNRLNGVVCDRPASEYTDPPATHLSLVETSGAEIVDATSEPAKAKATIREADSVVDALIGYGLSGAPRGIASELIAAMESTAQIVSLDVPSGIDATTGEAAGAVVTPTTTVTLALPKTGLTAVGGELLCADLGIPPAVYEAAGISYANPFGDQFSVGVRPRA